MRAWLWVVLFGSVCGFAAPVEEVQKGSIPAGQVHQGDYFAYGDSVEISGVVQGDLYLLAGQAIIDGEVGGDVIVAGASIDISGVVGGNVRALGGQVLISGQIGRNLSAIAGNVQLLPSGRIGQSVALVAGNVDVGSKIGMDTALMASNVRIAGVIGRRVNAYVGQLRITSKSRIGGSVDYQSGSVASIDEGAVIGGPITQQLSVVSEWIEGTWIQHVLVGGKVLALIMNFLYTLVIGLFIMKMFPKNLSHTVEVLKIHPWQACGWGIALMIIVPLICVILLMTVLGAPFALTLIAANIIGFYTAKIYSIFWVASWFFKKVDFRFKQVSTLLTGLILYFLLIGLPVIGVILSLLSMWFGLGAAVMAQARPLKTRGGVA